MPELRWILTLFGLALLIGIYVWGRRGAKTDATEDEETSTPRPEPAFEPEPSYDEFEPPLVAPIEDDEEREPVAGTPAAFTRPELSRASLGSFEPRSAASIDDAEETTLEAPVSRGAARDIRGTRIEPTFGDELTTAELPVHEPDPIPEPEVELASRPQSAAEAPTIGMSATPAPRRIERRKIIALRLAAAPSRILGVQLQAALEAESLQHGKYDVFHRLDGNGESMFSVASMVEPGTFDLEKMPQETYPGITLFAQLPGPSSGMLAFNELVACSRRLHASLGGTLQDERGVPLTVHRVERIRQEIREFESRPANETRSNSYSPAP